MSSTNISETVAQLRATFASRKTCPYEWRDNQLERLKAMTIEKEEAIFAALKVDLVCTFHRIFSTRTEVMNLSGKTVLLTGATAGIGHETLKALTTKGCEIIVLGRGSQRLTALEKQAGVKAVYRCDLANLDEEEAVVQRVTDVHPDIDVLINNAGIQQELLFDDVSSTNAAITMEVAVNFITPLYLMRGLLPNLRARPQAAIVNVTSILADAPKAKSAVYCGTKGGLRSFSKSLRSQLENTSVTVCEVLPPLVDTGMTAGRGTGKIPPSDVADSIVHALEHGIEEVYVAKASCSIG